ncbi:Uncharacterized protein PECH_007007 [Penicillium ucsense]|uniref:CCZ1/INTU/HSP4 first Longin domain-containing protein n=1 Tax=Penicillium ucsense TaxID=2839758 RepID=A0A8J8WH58_9EURO|nr:Uncharacterized protein PECM_006833 [Penicillium ucsense]KAF7735213.1 Uncharacterized protein PECH_007007 [Penicillium ucsense]
MSRADEGALVPAHLSYLAIYNPTLGTTDETLEEQIVFYTSVSSDHRHSHDVTVERQDSNLPENGKNEMLRQIGLAQGMVSFANNFSSGKPLECIETDRARIIVLELEKDWWIVASICLTRLPVRPTQASSSSDGDVPSFQYSAKEMGPPQFLIQQLRRAHSIFLLLHDFSMAELYNRLEKSIFKLFLEQFWQKFTWNWELLLAGNPIVDMYNGIKLAAAGELGIGVGEEEWGSGEREVLEDFVSRTDGLVDVLVSRFGDPPHRIDEPRLIAHNTTGDTWLGSDKAPRPSDGVIFSGIGAIDRHSLARVSHWMEWVYRYGDTAYGIGRDPASTRQRRPRKSKARASKQHVTPERTGSPGIPPPLIMALPQPIPEIDKGNDSERAKATLPSDDQETAEQTSATDTVIKYLTLGYGSAWSFSKKPDNLSSAGPHSPDTSLSNPNETANGKTRQNESQGNASSLQGSQSPPSEQISSKTKPTTWGRFVLGPRDDLDDLDGIDEGSPEPAAERQKSTSRIIHRSVHIRLGHLSDGVSKTLQAVIYVHQPFMFTFFFEPDTPALLSPSLYSSIHHQLGPLQKSLNSSTSPANAASRFSSLETGPRSSNESSAPDQPVYEIIYDSSNLTIRSSIPNIPDSGDLEALPQTSAALRSPSLSPSASPSRVPTLPSLSRLESLAIHERLLSTYIETRSRSQELERTYKVNRGWWIVWMRIPHRKNDSDRSNQISTASSSTTLPDPTNDSPLPHLTSAYSESHPEPHEAFVIRKASDHVSSPGHARMSSGARFFRDLGGVSSSKLTASRAESKPSNLVEGLGMDTRRYIEGLMSLNR